MKCGFEAIYAFVFRAGQKAERLWRYLVRGRASRGRRRARGSRDRISEKVHVSQRSEAATARQEAGHWESDLIICRRALHERKTRLTLMTRLAGKTAGETVAAIMAVFRRLEAGMRGSITFDNDTCFAHHALLRGSSAPPPTSATPTPLGRRAVSRTATAGSEDGCRPPPISTPAKRKTSRRSP